MPDREPVSQPVASPSPKSVGDSRASAVLEVHATGFECNNNGVVGLWAALGSMTDDTYRFLAGQGTSEQLVPFMP